MNRKELDFNNDETIKDVYSCANEVFGGGIAVPSEDGHPCGWDWLEFEEVEDILTHTFEGYEISSGYGSEEYLNLTLRDILKITNGKFAFEVNRNTVNWDED